MNPANGRTDGLLSEDARKGVIGKEDHATGAGLSGGGRGVVIEGIHKSSGMVQGHGALGSREFREAAPVC